MVSFLLFSLPSLLSAGQGGGGGGGVPRGVSQGDAHVPRCQLAATQAVSEEKPFEGNT